MTKKNAIRDDSRLPEAGGAADPEPGKERRKKRRYRRPAKRISKKNPESLEWRAPILKW